MPTLIPGDLPITTVNLAGVVILAVIDGQDVDVFAERSLDSVTRHRLMGRLRAHLAQLPAGGGRQLLLIRGAADPTCVTSDAVTLDTMPKGDPDGAPQLAKI